jgi:hypothetical protein
LDHVGGDAHIAPHATLPDFAGSLTFPLGEGGAEGDERGRGTGSPCGIGSGENVPTVLDAGRIFQISTWFRGRLIIAPTGSETWKIIPEKNAVFSQKTGLQFVLCHKKPGNGRKSGSGG